MLYYHQKIVSEGKGDNMKEECLICKAPLTYLEQDEMMECAIPAEDFEHDQFSEEYALQSLRVYPQ